MRASRTATLCLIGLLVTGCRSGGNSELLERELRCQEDAIYELEDALQDCEATIEAGRRENAALKQELAGQGGPALQSNPAAPRSRILPPKIDISPGVPSRTPARPNGPPEQPKLEAPRIELPGVEPPAPPQSGAAPGDTTGTDARPVRLVLNQLLTGGLNHDDCPGDEGIMVVFEPRNAAGQLVKPVGDVSVVVVDPAQQGAEARVARWDFTHDEAIAHFKKTALGRGYHFALPWPSQLPVHRQLQLFVRLTTPDGQKLVAESALNLTPPGLADGSMPAEQQFESTKLPSNGWTRASMTTRTALARQRAASRDEIAEPQPNFLPQTRMADETTAATNPDLEDVQASRDDAVPRFQAVRASAPEWQPYR